MGGSFTDEFGGALSGATGFLRGAWDQAISPALSGISTAAQHPAGNPWFQGLAALGVGLLAWRFLPTILSHLPGLGGDGPGARAGRGALSLVGVVALSLSAAAGMGMIRNDGPNPNRPVVSASEDPRLRGGDQPRSYTLSPNN